MKNLLYKEFRLCTHIMVPLFYAFALMILIPNYVYLIPCFFTGNAIFYSFQQSVQNNDLLFTALLPVSKRSAVKAKFCYSIVIELIMLLLYVPMILINHALYNAGNSAGIDACITLIGAGFIVFGIFNFVFMPTFYKTGYKAGKSFLFSTIAVYAFIFICEGVFIASGAVGEKLAFFNWIETHLDCWPSDGPALTAQLIALAVGAAVFGILTLIAFKRSAENYEKVDV